LNAGSDLAPASRVRSAQAPTLHSIHHPETAVDTVESRSVFLFPY